MATFLRVLGMIAVFLVCVLLGAGGGCLAGFLTGSAVPQSDAYAPLVWGIVAMLIGAVAGAVGGGILVARLARRRPPAE